MACAGLGWLFTVALLTGCNGGDQAPRALGQLAWDRLELTAESSEPIVAIPVTEGDRVNPGQLLVQLDPTRQESRLNQAKAERQRIEAQLAELMRGTRRERIEEAEARVAGARAALTSSEKELARINELAKQQLVSASSLDAARSARDRAQADLDAAVARLDELRHGATGGEVEQAREALSRAEAAQREAAVALDRLSIEAPVAARVDALPFKVGERPPAGGVVAVLLTGRAPYARVYIPEPIRASIALGTKANLFVDGRAEPFAGTVRRITSEPVFTPYFALTEHDRTRVSYLAEIGIDNPAPDLPAGVPVEARFERGPR